MNNTPKGLMPFDLEVALKDVTRVRTRNGRTVSQIFHADTVNEKSMKVMAVIDGSAYFFYLDGIFDSNLPSDWDLFITEPELYTAVYDNDHSLTRGLVSDSLFVIRSVQEAANSKCLGIYKLVKID